MPEWLIVIIIDGVWRAAPYILLSASMWLVAVGLVMIFRSVEGALTVWFWARFLFSAVLCGASCLWIHVRHAGISQAGES